MGNAQKEIAEKGLNHVKMDVYQLCQKEYEDIIANKITDETRIEGLFDLIWNYLDDEAFYSLSWKLINDVEAFDRGIGTFYRRIEEVHFEGS